MENAMNFSPTWFVKPVVNRPDDAISDLRLEILKITLSGTQNSTLKSDTPKFDDLVHDTISIVKQLFETKSESENLIIKHLHHEGLRLCGDAAIYIKAMINLWYLDIIPILSRDPSQGVSEDIALAWSRQGHTQWNSEVAARQQHFGNLGLMAMLLTSENWKAPECSKLQVTALVSNAATSMVFAAYMISFRLDGESWKPTVGQIPSRLTIKSFLQCAWQVARTHNGDFERGPGSEFGASSNEIKLSKNGKKILTKIGHQDGSWHELPFWHPCKRVPGSHWNKFLLNKKQPIFLKEDSMSAEILHRMPSPALTLAEPWEDYYVELRERIDAAPERTRLHLSGMELSLQHVTLASQSGHWYPESELDEDNATHAYDANQEYMYTVPLIKRPIADSRGHASLSFLTAAARAMRFETEPEEIESDLYMLLFGGVEADALV